MILSFQSLKKIVLPIYVQDGFYLLSFFMNWHTGTKYVQYITERKIFDQILHYINSLSRILTTIYFS